MLAIALRLGIPLLLFLVLGARPLADGAHARYMRVQLSVESECRALRKAAGSQTGGVCANDPFQRMVVPMVKEARDKIDDASTLLARGDATGARMRLDEVMELAAIADRRGLLLPAEIVANLVNQVLDFAEAHPGEIDVRDIASGARLRSLEHPLEGERLTRLWAMTSDWDLDPIREAWIAHRAVEFDARMREAELAVLADDPARCERASQADDLSVFYCDRGPKIARAGRRLASLRS